MYLVCHFCGHSLAGIEDLGSNEAYWLQCCGDTHFIMIVDRATGAWVRPARHKLGDDWDVPLADEVMDE